MADIKWIKIVTDVFDNRKIRQIELMPDSDAILVIWFKILCLAGTINESGMLLLTRDIPYNDEMLANQFNRPINTIRLALDTFRKFGMIETTNNILCVSNWEKYQNIETLDKIREQTRLRVAKHREQRKIANSEVCNVTVTQCNATEEDKKENKNKNKNKEEEQKEEEEVCMHGAKPVPEPAFIQLPLNDKSFYSVTFTAMDGWRELYPIVDIEQELRKMKGWLDSNPKKRKTSRGIKAFINGWLAREQDKGRQPTKGNTVNPFDELLRKELQNEQSRNNSPYEDNQRLLPGVLPEG
jgi:predicted phage replisome organizer